MGSHVHKWSHNIKVVNLGLGSGLPPPPSHVHVYMNEVKRAFAFRVKAEVYNSF